MSRSGKRGSAGLSLGVVTLLIVLVAVSLIGVWPFALGLFRGTTSQWERLSFIGQTYGAASAVISVLALVGVVLTLGYQARETKRAREETRREAVSDLLKMAMNDPDLDECWGPVPEPADPRTRKQQLYTNMIIASWGMSYEVHALPEHRLRFIANEMFQGQVGRDFWREARTGRLSTSANRRERRFHQVLDEEYQKVIESVPESVRVGTPGRGGRAIRTWRARAEPFLWAVAGAGAAATVCRLTRRRRLASEGGGDALGPLVRPERKLLAGVGVAGWCLG